MTFGDYLRVVRVYWRSLLAIVVVAAAIGAGVTAVVTPIYTSSAQVLFTGSAGTGGQDIASVASYTQTRMTTYRALVTTPQVLDRTAAVSGLETKDGSLADHIAASYSLGSTILTIEVSDESAERAKDVAEGVAKSLISTVEQIEKPNDSDASIMQGALVAPPTVPADPSSPNLGINVVGAALVGLFLGFGASVLRYVRSRSRSRAGDEVGPDSDEPTQ